MAVVLNVKGKLTVRGARSSKASPTQRANLDRSVVKPKAMGFDIAVEGSALRGFTEVSLGPWPEFDRRD